MLRKSIAVIGLLIVIAEGKLSSQSIFGVDVSGGAQGTINWQQVKTSGMTFGFAKATEGFTFNDAQFVPNMTNGKNAGVVMGAYHFARPDNNSAVDEANHFLSIAGPYIGAGYLPPVLDIEDPYASKISLGALNTWIQQWMTTVQSSKGVAPIIYTSGHYANNLDNSLHVYKLWIADPDGSPTSPPGIGTWPTWAFKQYSWTGSVPGISSAVDLDVFNGDQNAFNSLIAGACTTPNAPVANYGDDICPGVALTNTQNASLAFTSNGGLSFKAQVSKYPYGTSNLIFTSACGSSNPITATGLVKGMLYRWNMYAYGATDCSSCESAASNTKYFHLPPEITVNGTVSSPVSLCSGSITITTITQSPGSGATINYKWYKDGTLFQQGNSLTSLNVSSTGSYYLILDYSGSTDGCTTTVSTSQSNTIVVSTGNTITPSVNISANPSGAICPGQSVTYTATPSNGGATPSYQWQVNGSNVGTNNPVFTSSTLTNGQTLSCVMTSSDNCANPATATSNSIIAAVIPTIVPSITISQSSCNNNTVSFNSTIGNAGNSPSYLWRVTGSGTVGSGGVTSSSLELSNTTNGTQVYCTLTSNAACANPVQVTSNTLTINCVVTAVQQVDTTGEIKVMPNPNNGSFDVRIKLIASRKVSFTLSTVTGKIVYQSGETLMFGTQVKHFDQPGLSAGVYFLKIKIGVKTITEKIVFTK